MAVIYAYIIAFCFLKNNIKKHEIITKNNCRFGMFWQRERLRENRVKRNYV